MCQSLNLKDLVKLSVMPFTQKDEYLTNKDYVLIGKDITCKTCKGGTSTDWYAGNQRKHQAKYSDLLDKHWSLSYHGNGIPLSYSTFSKKDYLAIKKSLATYGFKYISVNSGNNWTNYVYRNQKTTIKLYTYRFTDNDSNKYEGDSYQIELSKN